MQNVNIVIMGKTGVGKSTLVNAVIGEEAAQTGVGGAVTQKNKVYSRNILIPQNMNGPSNRMIGRRINLYDTVGLEVKEEITRKTLDALKQLLEKTKNSTGEKDINLVWFCVNSKCKRFESYEVQLIKMLSYEYEIPFMIVLTQDWDGIQNLEGQIKKDMPDISVMRVLAKDFVVRAGVSIQAFGVQELLHRSIFEYHSSKVRILQSKLEKIPLQREKRIEEMAKQASICIEKHAKSAQNVGFIPGVCIPAVHGICIKMINEMMDIYGIHTASDFGADIFANVLVGLITAPLMCIPFVSAGISYAYVQTAGEQYDETLKNVIEKSTDEELKNMELMSERIRKELSRKK